MDEFERLKVALQKANGTVYEWDVEEDTITWTGNTVTIFGAEAEDIASQEALLALIHPEDKEKFISSLEYCRSKGGTYNRHFRIRLADGTVVPVSDKGGLHKVGKDKQLLIGTINSAYSFLQPLHTVVLASGKQEENNVYMNAQYFRAEFQEALTAAFAQDQGTQKNNVLLKVSIDNLPMLMTWYSLEFADRVMAALEFHLTDLLRKGDVIHRTSLDQFSIILKGQSESEAELVIDRILRRIQLYNNPSFEEPLHLRCSIGSVHFPKHAEDPDDAMNKAYLALCSAKNKSAEFAVDYQNAKQEHLDYRDETVKLRYIQQAFRDRRIRLAYQPMVEAKSGKIHSYECLLRLEDEEHNMESLGSLIPIAEKMGIIDIVDQYVLEQCIRQLEENPDIQLSFNVSNLTTTNPRWLKLCSKLLRHYDKIAKRIIVEITETAAQNDLRQTAYFIAALQEMGCRIALDDFGAGYTNFRQLKSLSVDMVKIDGSFIVGLEDDMESQLFIKSLLDFNHSYGLDTVAECVETQKASDILMELGVTYMQGNFYGEPAVERPWAKG